MPSCRLTRLVAEWVSGRFSWAAEKVGLGLWLALGRGWNAALDTVLDVWLHSLQEVHDEKTNDAWNGETDLGALGLTYTTVPHMQSMTTAYVVKTLRQLRG